MTSGLFVCGVGVDAWLSAHALYSLPEFVEILAGKLEMCALQVLT
jgi:hypothetical protein